MPNAPPPPLGAPDYGAIEAAVMETTRGRWFLAEYARRNRQADTEMLLAALKRLENVVRSENITPIDRLRGGLVDMAQAISRTKAEIGALKLAGEPGRIEQATEELDSVVSATEAATSDILEAAEHVQEIAWTLREQGIELQHCDSLDARATDIYTASAFQDLTGQRTRKVIQVLRYLETRIDTMIALWGTAAPPGLASETDAESGLLNGPAAPGQGLDQADVDRVMAQATAPAAEPDAVALRPEMIELTETAQARLTSEPETRDPMDVLAALTYAERVALFT